MSTSLLAPLLLGASAVAVLEADQAKVVARIVDVDPDRAGCRLSGANIEEIRVVARFDCAGAEAVVVLRHPQAEEGEPVGALRFDPQGGVPEALALALRDRIAHYGGELEWTEARPRGPPRPEEEAWTVRWSLRIVLIGLLLLAGAATSAGLVLGTRRPRLSFHRAPLTGMTWLALTGSVAIAAFTLAHFRFVADDFRYLIDAQLAPWRPEASLRLVSVTLLYQVADLVGGGRLPFIGASFGAWATAVLLAAALYRRLGLDRSEALLAAALVGASGGMLELVRWASGFQVVAALAVLFGVLLLVDAAARARGRRTWGLFLAAVTLTGVGMLVKFPMMAIVPPAAWIWGRFVVTDPAPPLDRHATYLVFPGVVLGVFLLFPPLAPEATEMGKLGLSAVGHNLVGFARVLLPTAGLAVLGVVVLAIERRLRTGAALAGGLGLGERAGRLPLALACALLGAAFMAPFLLNAQYFTAYYALPVLAWGAPLCSRAFHRLAVPRSLGAVIALALLVPYATVLAPLEPTAGNAVTPFLADLRRHAQGRPVPCAVHLVAECENGDDEATRARLVALYQVTDNGAGIEWATGWLGTPVEAGGSEGCEAERIVYCGVDEASGAPRRREK